MAELRRQVDILSRSVDEMSVRFQQLHPDALHPIVRHNVGNLLTGSEMGIRMANRLLEKENPADVPDCLARVKASLERVDSLLANPHLSKPHERVAASKFFSNAFNLVRNSTDLRGVPVSLELHGSLKGSSLEICRDGIHESLRVLIDNAVRATQTTGSTSPIAVRVEKDNGHIVVRVVDGGGGVPEAHRNDRSGRHRHTYPPGRR